MRVKCKYCNQTICIPPSRRLKHNHCNNPECIKKHLESIRNTGKGRDYSQLKKLKKFAELQIYTKY